MDRHMQLENSGIQMLAYAKEQHERQLLSEFSLFLHKYLQSKTYILDEHLLDAYQNILEALKHWARIVIIEEGQIPRDAVWNQVRTINTGVYKLYEELTTSKETLKQRIQLVLLACEFSVMSKMASCCKPLIDVLGSRPEPWSIEELMERSEIQGLGINLSQLLHKLVKKTLVKEVAVPADDECSELLMRYTLHP
ncbi:hypothetical protein [Paenibacillus sp. FJAT-26967]|uniref:hypothetical protein n=1 Tax=Paenibacillus sp. FJAT-26967 TaxID=1729690 RepID=UPI000838CD40|nr:hypothetical protein [Paenibacillus sp. FJAT-26967]